MLFKPLIAKGKLLAYHDRSDGGLLATVSEMMFAGRLGVSLSLDDLGDDALSALFNEELGAVLQIRASDCDHVIGLLNQSGLKDCTFVIGKVLKEQQLTISFENDFVYSASRAELQTLWSEVSYRMQALRDNPDCARQQFERIADDNDPGLTVSLTFDVNEDVTAPFIITHPDPKLLSCVSKA